MSTTASRVHSARTVRVNDCAAAAAPVAIRGAERQVLSDAAPSSTPNNAVFASTSTPYPVKSSAQLRISTTAIATPQISTSGTRRRASVENLATMAAARPAASVLTSDASGQSAPNQNAATATCTSSSGASSQRNG